MDFEKSSIERLKRTLYSRDDKVVPKEHRTPVSPHETNVSTSWGAVPAFDTISLDMSKPNNSFFNKFLLGSVVFFLVALGIAAYIFFGGGNTISSNNLDIKIVAPSSISSGEELLVNLSVVNGNSTDLENVNLFVDYPDGSQAVGGDNKPLAQQSVKLGDITSGASTDYSVRTILSGEKDAIKSFNFRLEYRVKGSNAVFSKAKPYSVVISSSPLLLNISYPKEINSGEPLSLSIDVTSNSSIVLKNSIVKVEYPYGFTYKDSNIKPLRGNSVWNIGDLKNGQKKTLVINGVLVGQNLEDRSFRVSAGTQSPITSGDFDVALASNTSVVGIRKSFFDLSVGPQSDSGIRMGKLIPVAIKWQDTLPDKILNTRVQALISGNAFDRSSVSVGNNGFYRSADNSIKWDKNSTEKLQLILPGDSDQVQFSVAGFGDAIQIRSIKNPHIDIHVDIDGDRSGTGSGPVSSKQDITLKFPSTVELTAKAVRTSGPFTNTGPVPPRADVETTYTIVWTLTNTSNDLKDVTASATLPSGVVWKGEISPLSQKIGYDPDSRVITWNISRVALGSGFAYSPEEVFFKVGLTPNISQVGLTPTLSSTVKVSGMDTYSETTVTAESGLVTTQYSDSSFRSNDNTVVK